MKTLRRLDLLIMGQLLGGLLATHCFGANYFIGVNFTGASGNGAPTSLDPGASAGVVPHTGWHTFSAYSVSKGILGDGAGNVTGSMCSYLTGRMLGRGTAN